MNCPNCDFNLSHTSERRTTTGVSRRYSCPCGLEFSTYRKARSSEERVSLALKQSRVDLRTARRALLMAAWEDCRHQGRLGAAAEAARQIIVNAKIA